MTYTILMFFLPVICFGLGVAFLVWGLRIHEQRIIAFGICLFIASASTALITFFALNTLA